MRRLIITVAAVVCCAAPAVAWLVGEDDPTTLRQRADAEIRKKNFKTALALYRKLPAARAGSADDRHVGVRILTCLSRLDAIDDLLQAVGPFIARAGDSLEAVQAHLLAGRGAMHREHDGTVWRGKFYRGEWKRGGQWTDKSAEDLAIAIRHLDTGRRLGNRLLALADDTEVRRLTITTQVELGGAIVWRDNAHTIPDGLEPPAATSPYDPKGPAVARVTWLMRDIHRLDTAKPPEHAARALYTLAAHLRQVGSEARPWLAEPRFVEVAKRFPGTQAAIEARYALGVLMQEQKRYVEAVRTWSALVIDVPDGRWATAARRRIEQVERPQLRMKTPPPVSPGRPATLEFGSRNCTAIACAAYRIDLREWIRVGLPSLSKALVADRGVGAAIPRIGAPVAVWRVATGDRGDHQPRTTTAGAPLTKRGAYAIVARSEGLVTAGLCIVSDVAAVVTADRTRVLTFVTDSETGQPIANAEVLVREEYRVNRRRYVNHSTGASDLDGVCVTGRSTAPGHGVNVQVVAVAGDRVAATPSVWSWTSRRGGASMLGYVETDRPVYRPGHQVHVKATLRRRAQGVLTVPTLGEVWVEVRDPKGGKLKQGWEELDEHGMCGFDLDLGERAVLGRYRIYLRSTSGRGRSYGGGGFRVEEYRRPEIEVTVQPGSDVTKIGQPVTAKVVARYYFGAPVANAEVSWRVARRFVTPRRVVSGPWDWLYGRGYGARRMGGPREGYEEVVASGTGTTGADGTLAVKVPTAPGEGDLAGYDQELVVWAAVTDASRRTIEGRGRVRVARRAVNLFVDPTRGYARAGETIEATVAALTAAGDDTDATGEVVLERLERADGDPRRAPAVTRIEAQPFTATAGAPAAPVVRFVVDSPGVYRLRAVAPDPWGGQTEGWTQITVTGDQFAGSDYRYAELDMTLDKPVYRAGDTAGVLLESPFTGGAALLTEVVGQEIVSWRVVRLQGRVGEAKIPLTKRHVPNAFLVARMVRAGEVRLVQRQVLVPPHDHMLKVEVTSDRTTYRPGAEAAITVRALGLDGKPVAGVPVSLGVVDRSLFYIQPEMAPDLRRFFYGNRHRDNVRRVHSAGYRAHGWNADHSGRGRSRGGRWPTSWWGFDWGSHGKGGAEPEHGGRRGRGRRSGRIRGCGEGPEAGCARDGRQGREEEQAAQQGRGPARTQRGVGEAPGSKTRRTGR